MSNDKKLLRAIDLLFTTILTKYAVQFFSGFSARGVEYLKNWRTLSSRHFVRKNKLKIISEYTS